MNFLKKFFLLFVPRYDLLKKEDHILPSGLPESKFLEWLSHVNLLIKCQDAGIFSEEEIQQFLIREYEKYYPNI